MKLRFKLSSFNSQSGDISVLRVEYSSDHKSGLILALLLISYVTLGMLHNMSLLQFPQV